MKEKNKSDNEFQEEIEVITEELETEHDLKVLNECWHISIHPRVENSLMNIDPGIHIKNLNNIGKIESLKVIKDTIPSFQDIEPGNCYMGIEIDLRSEKSKNEIEIKLNPLRDDFKIRILPPNSNISDYIELIEDLSDRNRRIGEILREIGSLTDFELEEVLNIQGGAADDDAVVVPIGELLVEEKIVDELVLGAALKKQKDIRDKISEK
jgi:two-component system chemotaxis sensor kinase CheA